MRDMGFNLEQLSLTHLRKLERELPREIERKEREERRIAFEAVEKKAQEVGLTRADLRVRFGGVVKARDSKSETGFRNPETGQVWPGRGRKPRWMIEFEARGGERASIEIRPEAVKEANHEQ